MAKHLKIFFDHEVSSKGSRFGRSYKKTALHSSSSTPEQLIQLSLSTARGKKWRAASEEEKQRCSLPHLHAYLLIRKMRQWELWGIIFLEIIKIKYNTLILGWAATLTKSSQDYRGGCLFQAPCDYYRSVQLVATQPYQAGHERRMDVIKEAEELLWRYHSLEVN